jgi:hypothetical protein
MEEDHCVWGGDAAVVDSDLLSAVCYLVTDGWTDRLDHPLDRLKDRKIVRRKEELVTCPTPLFITSLQYLPSFFSPYIN